MQEEAEAAALGLLTPTALEEALKIVSEIEASEATFTECVKNLRRILTSAGIRSKFDLNNKWRALKEQLKAEYITKRSPHQHATHDAHVQAFNRVLNKVFPTQKELAQAKKYAAVEPKEHRSGGVKAGGKELPPPFVSTTPVSVALPTVARGLAEYKKWWKTTTSSSLSPATETHMYGEFSVCSLCKIWFIINALNILGPSDKVMDFGAGTLQ